MMMMMIRRRMIEILKGQVLGRTFRTNEEDVTPGCIIFNTDRLYDLYHSPNVILFKYINEESDGLVL
jgi:hypothetical protein